MYSEARTAPVNAMKKRKKNNMLQKEGGRRSGRNGGSWATRRGRTGSTSSGLGSASRLPNSAENTTAASKTHVHATPSATFIVEERGKGRKRKSEKESARGSRDASGRTND